MTNDELAYVKQLISELSISDPITSVEILESGIPNIVFFDNASCGEGDSPPGF